MLTLRARLRYGLFALLTAGVMGTGYAQTPDVSASRGGQPSASSSLQASPALQPTLQEIPPATAQHVAPPPDVLWGPLFVDVQTSGIFPDSKTFVDMIPYDTPPRILTEYRQARAQPGFDKQDLQQFVMDHFTLQASRGKDYQAKPGEPVVAHIKGLWPYLTRQPDLGANPDSSLLPLPHAYVVPGGRFNEIYYWDSYFTMLGLAESGRYDLVRDMLANFAYLIDTYGHIPNGNRNYFLTRSQPPFFASMVELVAEHDGDSVYTQYLPELEREYAYWMQGAQSLAPGEARRHVVKLYDGTLLNRYWDAAAKPRQEAYREDVATANASNRPHEEVWRNLRAAAESGWDFSSRWLADGESLATIRTLDIAPVDLNALMVNLERTLAKAHALAGDEKQAQAYRLRASQREQAIRTLFWNEAKGVFGDLLWRQNATTPNVTAATVVPLFFGSATPAQAQRVADSLRHSLLASGGLLTTTRQSGQQWDAPNGWAPLQWMAVSGLRRYGEDALARTIAERWIETNVSQYRKDTKLVEKYNVMASEQGGGGEYPTQDGFGWTNGVLLKLISLYPQNQRTNAPSSATPQKASADRAPAMAE